MNPKIDTTYLTRSLFFDVIIYAIGTVIGVFIMAFLFFITGVGALLALFLVSFGIFIIPLWAIVGGRLFNKMGMNRLSGDMGIEILPDTHPIPKRVNELAQQLNLPRIKNVGWYKGFEINAFAAGLSPHDAMICFTQGAVEKLTIDELDAVMAHELAHVVNNDMRRMTYARNVQESLTWMLYFAEVKMFARWVLTTLSELAIMKLSRSREYYADAIGAVLVSPEAMKGALQKIEIDTDKPLKRDAKYAHLMFRGNPFNWFSTHPTVEQRIDAINRESHIKKIAR